MTNKSGKNGPKPLTTRQRAFIKELSKGQSAKDAAIVTGYAPKYARQQAYQVINRIKRTGENCSMKRASQTGR
jgi:transposase